MIYCLWLPFVGSVVGFVGLLADRRMPIHTKKHALAICVGYGALAAAVAQPIHNPATYAMAGIIAAMACSRCIWEAAK